MGKEIYLIVGLGNLGEKYAHTRHNAGFDVMEKLAGKLGVSLRKRLLLKGMTAKAADGDREIILCEPTTYMNHSGECVKQLLRRYGCPPERLMVIYDDIDLAPGSIRIRKNGGAGTHNGMRSIIGCIGTQDFPRIRIGTGDRPAGADLAEWVLGRCGGEERKRMEEAFEHAAESALVWVRSGINTAMNTGNRK